jgi:ATP synthase protein I
LKRETACLGQNEDETMASDPEDRDEEAALRARLDRLSGALKARKPPEPASAPSAQPKADGMGSAMSMGLRAGSEFVSAVIVGAGVGWVLDRGLGTNPAFLIVFFMIGVAAGVWNVIRVTSPKGGGPNQDSRLSGEEGADKGLRRSAPDPGHDAARGRGASGGAAGAQDGADDDED